jgi:ankyrin repeat protein
MIQPLLATIAAAVFTTAAPVAPGGGDSPVLATLMRRDDKGFVSPDRNGALQALLAKKPRLSFIEACGVGDADEVARQLRAQPQIASRANALGWTALHFAAFSGSTRTLALLLGATPPIDLDVRASNRFRNTPLMAALLAGQLDTAKLLLDRGADALVRQAQGYSPLHEAALLGRRDLVDLLLAHGAEVNVRANDGRTPRDEALRGGHTALGEYLRSKGAADDGAGRPRILFLVRHAEKSAADGDVPLSAAGRARAQELAAMLRDHKVDHVFTSQMTRTRETAQPLVDGSGAKAEAVPVEAVDTLVAKLGGLGPGTIAVVVNHSSKLPEIIAKLGGPKVEAIAEDEYDRLFILTRRADGTSLVSLRYGLHRRTP